MVVKKILTGSLVTLLAGLFLLDAAGFLPRAAALEPVQPSIDTVSSTTTTRAISISSYTFADIIISTVPLYRRVCVQNVSTTTFLACSESINVSTVSTHGSLGTIIPKVASSTSAAVAPTCFEVVAGDRFYCRGGDTELNVSTAVIRRMR